MFYFLLLGFFLTDLETGPRWDFKTAEKSIVQSFKKRNQRRHRSTNRPGEKAILFEASKDRNEFYRNQKNCFQ